MLGMVFGVFDGLDSGHRYFLTQAKESCRTLFIILTPDEVVGLLKNKTPMYSYRERYQALKKFLPTALIMKGDLVPRSWEVLKKYPPEIVFLGHDQHALANELAEKGVTYQYISKL